MSQDAVGFAEDLSIAFALFSATYAWDGLVRRHIHLNNLSVGRVDLRGWAATIVGSLSLLLLLGSVISLSSTWHDLFTACHAAPACTWRAALLPIVYSGGLLIFPLLAVLWMALWLWRVRGPEGYVRQWVGPGVILDEGELVQRVQHALAQARQPSIESDRILTIAHALKLRMASIALQRNSPFVENGRLVVPRFAGSINNSAFGNQFHLPKPQLQIVLTTIAEYYVATSRKASKLSVTNAPDG